MTPYLKYFKSISNQTKFQAQQPASTLRKMLLVVGGMMMSSFASQGMAIAQTTYPQYSVTAQYANGNCLPIRTEPNPDAFLVKCVPNGSVLETVIGEEKGWIQLNNSNWTWKASTSLNTNPGTTSPQNSGVIVQVADGCSNVRTAPSTDSNVVACLNSGTVLPPIMKEQNSWLQLSTGYWIWRANTNF